MGTFPETYNDLISSFHSLLCRRLFLGRASLSEFACHPRDNISLLFITGRAVLPRGWYLCVQDFHNQSQGKNWYLHCVSLSLLIFGFLRPVMTQGTI